MVKTFYITTAIDYANSNPHLGTAYEKIMADVIARYKRLMGYDVFFLMGNDEHSQNVYKKSKEQNLDPKVYCDQMADVFKSTWNKLNISYDFFIQTTMDTHKKVVVEMLQKIYDSGDIFLGEYEGFYCVSCEAFVQEKDLVDGKCPHHRVTPEWIKEKNYFFKLSKYRDAILKHVEETPGFIRPDARRNEILSVLREGLQDISISRANTPWGIPLPFDQKEVVYVWFDALMNYVSGVSTSTEQFQKFWPCDMHIIGKDITRFHCIIWPAMLMSAGMALPKSVFAHGFVTVNGQKMSKSLGTNIDPIAVAEKYTPDALRYFLAREVSWGFDGDFSEERLKARYNYDLANDLGNLVNRTLGMVAKYFPSGVKKPTDYATTPMGVRTTETLSQYIQKMDELAISGAIETAWKLITELNAWVNDSKPWVLFKEGKHDELEGVLYGLLEGIRVVSDCLSPFMPSKMADVRVAIGFDGDEKRQHRLSEAPQKFVPTQAACSIFPRME